MCKIGQRHVAPSDSADIICSKLCAIKRRRFTTCIDGRNLISRKVVFIHSVEIESKSFYIFRHHNWLKLVDTQQVVDSLVALFRKKTVAICGYLNDKMTIWGDS